MRNPNGYGGISNLGGNRRRPWRVRITTGWEYDADTGKHKQQYITLGYYATRKEAILALADYNKNPYNLDRGKVTFSDIYSRWTAEAFPKMSKSMVYAVSGGYKKLTPIHDMKMVDLKKNNLQAALDELADYSESLQSHSKGVITSVFKYCLENDILDKDYSQFLTISAKKDGVKKHTAYTEDEIRLLWDNMGMAIPFSYSARDTRDTFPVDTILICIYTGMRPGELLAMKTENIHLEDRYMIGGFKTAAGTDRIIPIHEEIYPLIKARVERGNKNLVTYKSDSPPTLNQYRIFFFDKVMAALNLSHLPHDGRHTFATFADRSDIKPHIIKKIMGHRTGDITKDVYTHKTIEELVDSVNKITFVKK